MLILSDKAPENGESDKDFWAESLETDQPMGIFAIAGAAAAIISKPARKKSKATIRIKGGPGSGHFSHAGRPGQVGGSQPKGGSVGNRAPMPKANPDGTDTMSMYMYPDGTWTPERQALHDKIIAHFFQGKTPVETPTSYMMGGGPASGKSTLLSQGLVSLPENSVLAAGDEIKAMLPEYGDGANAPFVHEESSYLAKKIAAMAAASKYNVVVDGTGDGGIRSVTSKVEALKPYGQKVVGIYVTVDTETAVQRSRARAQQTGRYMPEAVLRENHRGVSAVFPWILSSGVFDNVRLYDTNGSSPKLILEGSGVNYTVYDQAAVMRFMNKARE